MKIKVIDNLKGKTESLSQSKADNVVALIRKNTQDVNQGEYRPADLERLNDFATPEKIQKELERGYLAMLFNDEKDLIGCALVVRRGNRLIIKTLLLKPR